MKRTLSITIFLACLLLGTSAFALIPQTATFEDIVTNIPGSVFNIPGSNKNPQITTWAHTLENTDFTPNWGSNTIILSIDSANLLLNLTFNFSADKSFKFKYDVYLDDIEKLGGNVVYHQGNGPATTTRTESILFNTDDLLTLQDKEVMIKLSVYNGTLNSINSSTLSGTATVAPEPVSMLLVAAGLAGLPIAARLRKRRCG